MNKKLILIICAIVFVHILAIGLTIYVGFDYVTSQSMKQAEDKIVTEHEVIKNRFEDHKETINNIFNNLDSQSGADISVGNYKIQQAQIDIEADNILTLIVENKQRIIDLNNKTNGSARDFDSDTQYYENASSYLKYTKLYGEFNREVVNKSEKVYEKITENSSEENRGTEENYGELFLELSTDFYTVSEEISAINTSSDLTPIKTAYADYYSDIGRIYNDLGVLYNEMGDSSSNSIDFYSQKFTEIEATTAELDVIDEQFKQTYLDAHSTFLENLSDLD